MFTSPGYDTGVQRRTREQGTPPPRTDVEMRAQWTTALFLCDARPLRASARTRCLASIGALNAIVLGVSAWPVGSDWPMRRRPPAAVPSN